MAKDAFQDPQFMEWINCVWKHAEAQVSKMQPSETLSSEGLADIDDLDLNEEGNDN